VAPQGHARLRSRRAGHGSGAAGRARRAVRARGVLRCAPRPCGALPAGSRSRRSILSGPYPPARWRCRSRSGVRACAWIGRRAARAAAQRIPGTTQTARAPSRSAPPNTTLPRRARRGTRPRRRRTRGPAPAAPPSPRAGVWPASSCSTARGAVRAVPAWAACRPPGAAWRPRRPPHATPRGPIGGCAARRGLDNPGRPTTTDWSRWRLIKAENLSVVLDGSLTVQARRFAT
jgi:hypothetical protein